MRRKSRCPSGNGRPDNWKHQDKGKDRLAFERGTDSPSLKEGVCSSHEPLVVVSLKVGMVLLIPLWLW